MLKPGRTFTMVENIQSKTKTPTGVAFKDDERLFGPETLIAKARFPKQSLNYIDRYLGEEFGSQPVQEYLQDHFVAYDVEEDGESKSFNFKLKYKGEEFFVKPEEHFGMLFKYMKTLAEKFADAKVYEAVVSVPNSWGYKKRHSLSIAARLGGLELKGIVTQNTAAAVYWMTDKSFNETAYYIFYNMGSTYTQATLVSLFSRYETDKKNKTTEYREVTVLGETWDDKLGGRDFDFKLVRMLMDIHDKSDQKKGKPSIKDSFKVAEKILPNAIKYKEVLSANKQVGINILGVEPNINLISLVQKTDFEDHCKDLLDRIYLPIERLLMNANMTISNITAVELIGGGIRVPKIQDILKEKLGDKLGIHMNGDDSIAFGTAYMFANSTKHFKVAKRVYVNSGPAYEIKINIDPYLEKTKYTALCDTADPELIAEGCTRRVAKNTTLFKLRHGSDVTRTVTFKHDSDIQIKVYEHKEDYPQNTVASEQHLITFYVSNFDEVKQTMKNANINALPKTHLRFKSNEAGIISLTVDVSYEADMYFARIKGVNNTEDFKYVDEFVAPLADEELESELTKLKAEGKNETDKYYTRLKSIGMSKKTEKKIDLKVERVYTFPKPLNKTEFEASKKKLQDIDDYEIERVKNMEARNKLESDIYATKEWLETEDAKTYANENERDQILEVVRNISEWYEDEGYKANTTLLNTKHEDIKSQIKPIERRTEKHHRRIKASGDFLREMEKLRADAEKLVKSRDWLENHHREVFSLEFTKAEAWFQEKNTMQNEKPLHEETVFTAEQIDLKLKTIRRELSKLKEIPKPKPAEEVKAEEDKNNKKEGGAGNVSKEEIEKLLKKLKDKESGGPDTLTDEDKENMKILFVNIIF